MKVSITSFAAVMVASTQAASQWYGGAPQRSMNRSPYGQGALAPQRPQYNDYRPQFGQQRPQY